MNADYVMIETKKWRRKKINIGYKKDNLLVLDSRMYQSSKWLFYMLFKGISLGSQLINIQKFKSTLLLESLVPYSDNTLFRTFCYNEKRSY